MYDLEDQARDWDHESRKELRLEKAKPILIQMKTRLDQVQPLLRPSSTLADAVDYLLGHWKELNVYLEDGRIPIDNNWMERNFKAIATGKKNWLFLGRETAGETMAVLYTIVRNAVIHNLELFYYLDDVLRKITGLVAEGKPLDELLPEHWAKANPKRVQLNRIEENRQAQIRKDRKRNTRRKAKELV
jgi:hypothetical protein